MFIREIHVENYRNIGNVKAVFAKPCTFIVGENNLGKTNLLKLLSSLFNRSGLDESDFDDRDKPIIVRFSLILEDYEIGRFDDVIDPGNMKCITIVATADEPDSEFQFVHEATGESISAYRIREACYFLYESLSSDSRTLNYNRDKGPGRVLTKGLLLYQDAMSLSTLDFFDKEKLDGLVNYLNCTLDKLSILSSYGIHAGIDEKEQGALGAIVTLTDNNGLHFKYASSGVQYVALIVMQILESIMRLSKGRLEKNTFHLSGGKTVLPVILAFDEPEIHLHPYMQRTLTKYLCSIANGEDDSFNDLIKEYFDIDSIAAQVIIATHSPSIITSDYATIVRFGLNKSAQLVIANGSELSIGFPQKKQMIALFGSIKEAFFSRGVLVVEGVTESASLPRFALSLGIDLDALGIVIVSAGGKKSVSPICNLLEQFGIQTWSIVDRDNNSPCSSDNHITTVERDFEAEIIGSLFKSSRQDVFIELLEAIDQRKRKACIQASKLEKESKNYHPELYQGQSFNNMDFDGPRFDGAYEDNALSKLMMYCWLIQNKDAITGTEIGTILPAEAIPDCYKNIIQGIASGI